MPEKRIHAWDGSSILKALGIGTLVEAIASAPVLSSGWGHAGPETTAGWLSVLFNLPGIFAARLFPALSSDSTMSFVVVVFVVQTLILSYLVFVVVRWRNVRRGH